MEIGVAKGKKLYDKRDDIAKKIKNGKHRENLRSETYSVAAKRKEKTAAYGKRNCYDTRH